MFLPVERSITVSAPQRVAHTSFSTSSSIDEVTALLPMLALILTRKLRPIAIGSSSGWLTLAGQDRAAARHLVAHELGRDDLRNRRAERLAGMLRGEFAQRFGALALADRDELHLGRDLAAPRVVHLGDAAARRGAQHRSRALEAQPGEARVVLARAHERRRRSVGGVDVAARADPAFAQRRESAAQVDRDVGIGERPRGVVERRSAGSRRGSSRRRDRCGASATGALRASARARRAANPRRRRLREPGSGSRVTRFSRWSGEAVAMRRFPTPVPSIPVRPGTWPDQVPGLRNAPEPLGPEVASQAVLAATPSERAQASRLRVSVIQCLRPETAHSESSIL